MGTAFAPSDGKRYLYAYGSGAPGKTTLAKDGKVIGSSETVGQGQFVLPTEKGRYTLTTSGTRQADYSNLDTTSSAEWTFDSAATTQDTRLALSLLRVGIGNSAQNPLGQVKVGSSHVITLAADPQPGATVVKPRGVPTLELSYDNGATWQRVPVGWGNQAGNAWLAEPRTAGFVSLRTKATDANGSTVIQTVIPRLRTGRVGGRVAA